MQKDDGTYIKTQNIIWHPNIDYSDCLKVFVDQTTGWAYEIDSKDEGKAHVSHYIMSFNMYEKICWKCKGKIVKTPTHNRCFFCSKCCTLKKHVVVG